MAAKRISQSAINWAQLAERVPEHQKVLFTAFKAKSDGYMRRVTAFPETAPKIDWAFYKGKVPVAGMVDDFQKQYEALSIPYPPNPLTGQLDSLEKDVQGDVAKFKSESNNRIEEYKKQLAHLASLIPYDQMTMEDYKDAFPAESLDPLAKPSFWPHLPEEQLGYKDKDLPADSGH